MDDGGGTCSGRRGAEERRRHLIETARRLFQKNGFHATGMAEIARCSGIAMGQIYRDFASKEELVATLVETDCAEFLCAEELDQAIAHRDLAAVQQWLRRFMTPPDRPKAALYAEIFAEAARNERIAAIVGCLHTSMRKRLEEALSLFHPAGASAADRAALPDLVLTLAYGLLYCRLSSPAVGLDTLVQRVADLLGHELLDRGPE